jgi:hypothetical protein
MPSVKTLTRSFAGGEITPEMYGRLDNVKFQTGLSLGLNGIVLPHGPFTKRPGFAYVNSAGDSTRKVRVIPFSFNATQTMVLEFGHLYIRFHTLGATLLNGGSPYQITSPYDTADLFDLEFTQSADVITITHPGYQVRELRRLSAVNWQLTTPTLGSSPAAPTSPTATISGPGGGSTRNIYYKVTSVTADGLEESLPTTNTSVAAVDLSVVGNRVTVAWTAPGGLTSPSYRVYKTVGGPGRLYGFMGETTDLSFVDDNITPDYSKNPPASVIRLDTAGNYPGAVSYFEQRRCFAGTTNNPQALYLTRTATESNLAVSNPSNQSDALSFTIKAQQQNTIRHLVPLSDLLAFTVGGVFRAYANGNALLPNTIMVKPQTFYGASNVKPQLTGNSCLYVETNGRRVRDISYSWEAQVYTSDDRSVMAPHLFLGYTIVDMAYSRSPDQILWAVRSDGVLLSLAYVPEHQVFGWTQHTTDGFFESVCTVAENNEDVLYAVVRRTLNGTSTRTIERMATRQFATQADAFFVDCGATYSGAPATTISGLSWLNGKTVVALADGAVVTNLPVSGGSVTLPVAASKVQIGLPYTMDLQTLPMSIEGAPAGGQGTQKAIDYAYLRVFRTGLLKVGPSFDRLTEVPARTNEPYDSPPRLLSEQIDLFVQPDWGEDAQLCVRSDTPTPATVSSITMKVSIGG